MWQLQASSTQNLAIAKICKYLGLYEAMWRPCGVIVLLGELFISELKTQVYGYLHNFFVMHPDVAKCIAIMEIKLQFFVM